MFQYFSKGQYSLAIFLSIQQNGLLYVVFLYMLSLLNLSERKSACFEDEESELFIEVDCFNVEPVLSPAPDGLSQQQVMNMPFNFYSNLCNSLLFEFAVKENYALVFPPLQLVRRCILGSILESEKNYLDALKRILEVSEYGWLQRLLNPL